MATAIASAAAAADRTKFEFWYGLTGDLGEVIQKQCQLFNESQDKYEAVCVGQGGYDKAEQNTIAAYRAKQQPTVVQIYDAGTVNFMLSGAIYPAVKFAKDFGHQRRLEGLFPRHRQLLRHLGRRDVVVPLQFLDRRLLLEQGRLGQDRQDRGARRPGPSSART